MSSHEHVEEIYEVLFCFQARQVKTLICFGRCDSYFDLHCDRVVMVQQ